MSVPAAARPDAPSPTIRRRLLVTGVVQGVGFRPFVHGAATRLGLTGFVLNSSAGARIEVQGPAHLVERFVATLATSPPPLARIDAVQVADLPVESSERFTILESRAVPHASTSIPPDVATCDDCLRELSDPADRRYRYPFVNCTNCGPRFTIIRDLPYDRPTTTMAGFAMCEACAREYHDPADRRFHAQPIACPRCGPRLRFTRGPLSLEREDALQAAVSALAGGEIVAVKGLGGFHLACDATSDEAVRRLRDRKGRVDKPFAVMVASLDRARELCDVTDAEAARLSSNVRPILLLRRRAEPPRGVSALVAPGNAHLGVMLPYTPLHHLLVGDAPLVMTSGNRSDEPIARENEEAFERLGALADAFLTHDRDIHVVCDDSVVRVFDGRDLPVRRSRGYAPFPVRLPFDAGHVLAAGGELKSTFCLTRGEHAYVSQHIGDMENLETLAAFERAAAHFATLFRVAPARLAADPHPGYLSSRWARETAARDGVPLVEVQHHHAHVAAVMAEHRVVPDARVIGISFDGTGYGPDGAIWGGEVLEAGYEAFTRRAHLRYVPLPGGDAAIRRPYRVALAHLWAAGLPWDPRLPCVAACPEAERTLLRQQLERGLNTVPTSSMGRLFDAAASLLGVRQTVTYEAQAAMEMEAIARETAGDPYAFGLVEGDALVVDPAPVWERLLHDLVADEPVSGIAWRFHDAVARVTVAVAARVRDERGLTTVGLSGGVFQNVLLLDLTVPRLRAAGFTVLVHHLVPPNDGGLALGQAAVAARQGGAGGSGNPRG